MITWPWGRSHPNTRLRELHHRRQHLLAQRKIIEQKTREALRNVSLNIDATDQEIKVVEGFLKEAHRRDLFARAYRLEAEGVPVLDLIKDIEDNEEIENRLQKAQDDNGRSPRVGETKQGVPVASKEIDEGFFDDAMGIDELTADFLKTGDKK